MRTILVKHNNMTVPTNSLQIPTNSPEGRKGGENARINFLKGVAISILIL